MVRIIIETDGDGRILHATTDDSSGNSGQFEDAGGPPADLLVELGEADFVAPSMADDDTNAEDAGGPPADLGGTAAPAVSIGAQAANEDDAEDAGGPPDWLLHEVEAAENDDGTATDTGEEAVDGGHAS